MRMTPGNFDTRHDFYDLPEKAAHGLIGQPFIETKYKHGDPHRKTIFFPVGLSNKWENYGYATGLIFVSPVWPANPKTSSPMWFRCGWASPDDGDIDLDFEGEKETRLRSKVLKFLWKMPWYDTSIREVLTMVRDHVGAGIIS